MAGITITTIENERTLSEYLRRRGELRDALRFGVYPNLVQALKLHEAFVKDYAQGGKNFDAALWEYYTKTIAPIADQQEYMIAAAQTIVAIMEAVDKAVPDTFGIVPSESPVVDG
jgi:hypothetical protein